MTQKNLSLQKAVELRMEPISQNQDNNFSTWEALIDDYLNEEKKNLNSNLSVQGIVLTMFDSRNNLSEMVVNDVKQHFGKQVYQTIIPRNVRVSEAPSFGQPVLMYDINCPGSKAYASLAAELLQQESVNL